MVRSHACSRSLVTHKYRIICPSSTRTFYPPILMLIVVADDLPKSALALLTAEGWTVDSRSGRTPEQLSADLKEADAIVVRSATKVTAEIIAAAPKLRAIARAGTGVDNVNVDA